jgi:cytoskeleton protein RodZ
MSHSEHSDLASIGRRLREAREARGATTQDAAAALHLPLVVIESLEAERFQQLGAAIYVRGHLRSYLRWLALPEVLVESALKQVDHEPPALRSATHVPHLRYLADRYAVRAVYVLLTLSIIVPALWVATEHANLGAPREAARSLDQAPLPLTPAAGVADATTITPSAAVAATVAAPLVPPGAPPMPAAASQAIEEHTVIASLAPFYGSEARTSPQPELPSALEAEQWQFRFLDDSWVEIVGSDGQRLEYGIVRAGAERRYPAGAIARVALGNATAVRIARAGSEVDFERFRRANVARFAVSSEGELRPLGE